MKAVCGMSRNKAIGFEIDYRPPVTKVNYTAIQSTPISEVLNYNRQQIITTLVLLLKC